MLDKNFNSVEKEAQTREMVSLLKAERTTSNANERKGRLTHEVYCDGCGYIPGGKVEFGLKCVEYMLISGHAFQRANKRHIDHAKLVEMANTVINNWDAFYAIDDNRVLPVFGDDGHIIDGAGEDGKISTVVQMEGSNILLIIQSYKHGVRVVSCWNTHEGPHGLQEHDTFLFVRKDGSITRKLTGDVFVFRKTKRV